MNINHTHYHTNDDNKNYSDIAHAASLCVLGPYWPYHAFLSGLSIVISVTFGLQLHAKTAPLNHHVL